VKIFKIPARLLVLGDGPKKAFDYMIKTDGVGALVTCCKWVSKSLQVKGEACGRAYEEMPRDPVYIGINPGGRTIVATAREGNSRSGYSLSSKQYYHECKMNERKLLKDKHLKEAGLSDWLTATPARRHRPLQRWWSFWHTCWDRPCIRRCWILTSSAGKSTRGGRWISIRR
jgi:hypothetical protein